MASSTLENGENPKVYKYVRLVRALDISKNLYDEAVDQYKCGVRLSIFISASRL